MKPPHGMIVHTQKSNLTLHSSPAISLSDIPSFPDTLSILYKGQSIWDGRRDSSKNKGQSLGFYNGEKMVQGTKIHCHGKGHSQK